MIKFYKVLVFLFTAILYTKKIDFTINKIVSMIKILSQKLNCIFFYQIGRFDVIGLSVRQFSSARVISP